MTGEQIIEDAEVVEHGHLLEPAPASPPPSTLFRTDDPVEVVEKATQVANALSDVIKKRNLFTVIQDKKHVRVEGWQLLGSMLGVTAVCVHTEQIANGWKAIVEARTADGRVIGRADALCTKDERRGPWKSADEYARLSMAQTRATSKALKGPLGFVVSLAGYETTPAEEMTFAASEPDANSASDGRSVAPAPRQAPTTIAQPAEHSEPAASGPQKGKINYLFSSQGLDGSDEQKAILQWVTGTQVLDRVSKRKASKLIDQLDAVGGSEILAEITTQAEQGDERAKTIVDRYKTSAA